MPSSMIFAGLVMTWLLVLVPAVARHRQEVARPSLAALSGRVLERPRRRSDRDVAGEPEVDVIDERDVVDRAGTPEDPRWERPPPRYRPGRGGYDAEAAALAARARYGFRQRTVLALLVAAVVTGVVAAVAVPGLWLPHSAVDLGLVGYLVYLRRQVRLEESIRYRRAARMAGTRRPPAIGDPAIGDAADDPTDERDRRGRDESRRPGSTRRPDPGRPDHLADDRRDRDTSDDLDDLVAEDPERVPGTGDPVRRDPAEPVEIAPALPRLQPVSAPPLPAGTSLVDATDDDLDLADLTGPARPGYRRAAGQ